MVLAQTSVKCTSRRMIVNCRGYLSTLNSYDESAISEIERNVGLLLDNVISRMRLPKPLINASHSRLVSMSESDTSLAPGPKVVTAPGRLGREF